MISELTILISRRAHLSALRHLSRDLRDARPDLRLYCVCPRDLIPEAERSLGPEATVTELPRGSLLDLRRRLHTLLLLLFAAEGFSQFFRRRLRSSVEQGRLKSLLLRTGRRLTPKLDGPALNRFLTQTLSLVSWRRTFPTRRVAVLTKCSVPHLLCTRRHEIFSVLDGWDHPTTSPLGYRTTTVAAWNEDLADDWRRMQGAVQVVPGYPYRFAYVLRSARPTDPADGQRGGGRPRLLYAMATFPSRSPLDQSRHEEEKEVVRRIHPWLLPHVSSFDVKPHPIGPAGHLDRLAEECPGIVIHPYEGSGAATYDLTDGYNRDRISTLAATDLVVGIWTTFLLDAAMTGKAIALIDIPDSSSLRALWTAKLGLHVHHLRRRVDAVVALGDEGPSFDGQVPGFETFLERARGSGLRVARWLKPDETPRALAQRLLADRLGSLTVAGDC